MRPLQAAGMLILLAATARGAETASFLNIGAGARPLSMGGAYAALADGADALYWNPAGLASAAKREVTASHAELTVQTRQDFLAYAHPSAHGTFAGGVTYLSHEPIEGRDAAGRPTAAFGASDAVIAFGYGAKGELADLGVAVKYVRSHIGASEAQTAALDAGLQKAFGPIRIGAVLRNAGPGLKYDRERNDLPLRLGLGAALRLKGGHAVAVEVVNGPRGAGTDGSVGGEFQALENIFMRAGFDSRALISGGSGFEAARGLTLGMGFKDARWELVYATLPMGELGNTHRFTLGARF